MRSRLNGLWSHRVKDWLAAVLVLAGLVIAFSAFLYVAEESAQPNGLEARQAIEFVRVTADGSIDPASPVFTAPYNDAPIYRTPIGDSGNRVAFRIPFRIAKADADLAFFLGATPGVQEIRLNGAVLQPNTPLDTLRGATDGTAAYYMLPTAQQRVGQNEILVFIDAQSSVLALAPFSIGPATEAARAVRSIELLDTYIPIMAVSFLVFAILLIVATQWPQQDRARVRALMVVMLFWALRTCFITFPMPFEIPFLITAFTYYALEASVIFAFALHLLAGEQIAPRWSRLAACLWVGVIVYLIVVTAAGFAVGPAIRGWFKAAAIVHLGLTALLGAVGLTALAWAIAHRRDGRWLERISLAMCLMALLVDAGDSVFALHVPFRPDLPLTFYITSVAGLLLGLGVVASIAREASQARQTVIHANAILAERLAEQDAELSRSYEAQRQMLQRQVTLEERQRIVRDMHDGIGGQLLGLMMQVRSGATEPKVIEEGLQSSIADLRLIVDSMDTADESLTETLRSFEHRVRAQVEAAGMVLRVDHGLDEAQPGPGPRPTLQILRILQEAVSNAMRHSRATVIALDSGYTNEGNVRISISDDGVGMPAQTKGGRGLTSMHTRAKAVGGTLHIASARCGTSVELRLSPIDAQG